MAMNTSAEISGYILNIFEDAMFVARESSVMPSLVTVYNDTTDESRVRQRSEYGAATINDIGETDDLQSQAFTPTAAQTLTPSEAGAQYFLTDTRLSSDPFDLRNDASMELGMATAKKVNSDLLGEMANLTGGTVGSAGTTITWGHFFAALSQLRNQKAPEPYFCVMHVFQWHHLAKAASTAATSQTNAPMFQDEVQSRWYVGTVGGVQVYATADLTIDSDDDTTGGMFSRQAVAFDQRRAPRMEPERDASRRGWELNMTTVYAHGVWRPAFGIQMVFDASTPSS